MLLGIHFKESSRQASPICSDYISHLSKRKFIFIIFPTILTCQVRRALVKPRPSNLLKPVACADGCGRVPWKERQRPRQGAQVWWKFQVMDVLSEPRGFLWDFLEKVWLEGYFWRSFVGIENSRLVNCELIEIEDEWRGEYNNREIIIRSVVSTVYRLHHLFRTMETLMPQTDQDWNQGWAVRIKGIVWGIFRYSLPWLGTIVQYKKSRGSTQHKWNRVVLTFLLLSWCQLLQTKE